MTEEEDMMLIDRFIEGSLSDAEAESVRNRIASDRDFAALYNDMKYLLESTRVVGRRELIEFLQKEDEMKSPALNWYWISGIAASLVIAAFFIFNNRSHSLVDEYFKPYPNTIVPVVRGTALDSSKRAFALKKYELGDYAEALRNLQQLDPPNTDDIFYMGICALAMKDYNNAVAYLSDYESKGESFLTQTKWYLALAYLGAENVEQSRSYLEDIAQSDSGFEKQAADLLTKIDHNVK